ncbi:CvpA family protein [Patescibacteria group bacterium]|nr:CvpA family protein [Patescibacteria group bacterium]MBU1663475.1 CvpA family protein [Patescibacteria group bacterium]MBU1933720.1 CvpA family protein [Patescibacteria group bacterium]MBU2007666.1 CvpA family protein [Patescibacteria group bacterium]MBU2233318.1 CvpA family protein [Patescibacteria group bacterium]
MAIFDLILLIILAGFVFYGLFFGLIRTTGSLLGVIGGLWLSLIFYLIVFGWVKSLFFGHDLAGKIIIFFVLFTLINRLICLIFILLDQTFNLISVIPFLKTINRLTGACLGFIEGGLVLGLVLVLISQTALIRWLDASKLAPFFLKFINALMPLLPDLLMKLK